MNSSSSLPPTAIGLDLGTTQIKAGALNQSGQLDTVLASPPPPLTGQGLIRESDPDAYLSATESLLQRLHQEMGVDLDTPLGIATQRSSFLLWDESTGRPVTPLISWQDRRSTEWCKKHESLGNDVHKITGLRLSPHYVGPKLACLMESNSDIRTGLSRGDLLLGTFETYLLWKWSEGSLYETDLTMAARTLLMDVDQLTWAEPLLDKFGIPKFCLPYLDFSTGKRYVVQNDMVVTATLAGGL
ncbi:MAG: hypothetical protein GKR87_12720 [Kiritimatiellae bacterium]|nr:hypothetical protein [Kiritimatiellia bacterium]